MKKNLDTMIEAYNAIQEQEAELKAAKEELKQNILGELAAIGSNSYTTADGLFKGTVANKATVKYTDEVAIIDYLQNNGMSSYLKTTIDTTAFNKTLKGSQSLQESLAGKFTVSESPALTVKKVL